MAAHTSRRHSYYRSTPTNQQETQFCQTLDCDWLIGWRESNVNQAVNVIMNGTARRNADVTQEHAALLDEFLAATQPVQAWQSELVKWIKSFISQQDFLNAMRFFQHVLQSGIVSLDGLESGSHTHNRHTTRPTYIRFDANLMPKVLDMNTLKRLLISLRFEIEEPDGYHRPEDMSIALSEGSVRVALEGMLLLVNALQELPWQHLAMLIRLSTEEARILETMLQSCPGPVPNRKEAKSLCDQYPCQMKELGFRTEHRNLVGSSSALDTASIRLAIKGLFHGEPKNGEIFI